MKIDLTLTGEHLAAGAAVVLGIVLALASTVARGTDSGPANTTGIVQIIIDEKDHVTAGELAQWIIEKRADYQLIDIRLPWQFDDYHIPGATNIPLSQLFQADGLKQLSRSKKVVVYGLGAGHTAEAQLLLSMKGYNALSVREGVSAWWNDVMTPMSLRSETQSPGGYQQARALRQQFMGGPAEGKAATLPPAPAPEAPPVGQPSGPPGGKKLKLGRGCS